MVLEIEKAKNLQIKKIEDELLELEQLQDNAMKRLQIWENVKVSVVKDIELIEQSKLQELNRIEGIRTVKIQNLEQLVILEKEKTQILENARNQYHAIEQNENLNVKNIKFEVMKEIKEKVKVYNIAKKKVQILEQALNIEQEKFQEFKNFQSESIEKVKTLALEIEEFIEKKFTNQSNIKILKIEKTVEEFIKEENAFIELINNAPHLGQSVNKIEYLQDFIFSFIETSIKLEYLKLAEENIHEISSDNVMDIAKKINLALYEVFPYIEDHLDSSSILNMIFNKVKNFHNDKKI
jgi:hypothetical protein